MIRSIERPRFKKWLKNRRKKRFQQNRQLQFELLEDRRVLATYTVTGFTDGPGVLTPTGIGTFDSTTLRGAVIDANLSVGVADTIVLPAGTYTLTSAGSGEDAAMSGDLDITDDLTISGAGAATTIIDATGLGDRVFHIPFVTGSGITVDFIGITITKGLATDAGTGFFLSGAAGGGILNEEFGSTITIADSVVTQNAAVGAGVLDNGQGGGIADVSSLWTITNTEITFNDALGGESAAGRGGGFFSSNTTTALLIDSIISNNQAVGGNDLVDFGAGAGEGGGIYNEFGTWTSVGSTTIDSNLAKGGDGLSGALFFPAGGNASGGGIYDQSGTWMMMLSPGSAITRNQAVGGDGDDGGDAKGGGIFSDAASFALQNNTISNNSAVGGNALGVIGTGGDATGGGVHVAFPPTFSFDYVTIAENDATGGSGTSGGSGRGGGIFADDFGQFTFLHATIVATNTASTFDPDLAESIPGFGYFSSGYNLIGDVGGTLFPATTGDQVGPSASVIPGLGPLFFNGGPTETHALMTGSSAIDAADPGSFPAFDQRGSGRPVDGDGDTFADPDIGAYEAAATMGAAGIDIEKFTNGIDADTGTGPLIPVGGSATFTYTVSNTGGVDLTNVVVTDSVLGTIAGPISGDVGMDGVLGVGEIWTYQTSAPVTAGPYMNTGTVTADDPSMNPVTDMDDSNHFGVQLGITIEKETDGQDADSGPGPEILVGGTATFTYTVTNTGNVGLENISVSDSVPGVNPVLITNGNGDAILDPLEFWTYGATTTVTAGQYVNTGTVLADDATDTVPGQIMATDDSHHFGAVPSLDLTKLVSVDNGSNFEDANSTPGPTLFQSSGFDPIFRFVLENTGNVDLTNVLVTDSVLPGTIIPPTPGASGGDLDNDGILDVGETWTVDVTGTFALGDNLNVGTATADYTDSQGNSPVPALSDNDPANYFGAVGKQPDPFEDNDTLDDATVLGSLPAITLRDLSIHEATDVDFFKYTAADTGKLILNVYFAHNDGNLDLRVRDMNDNIIASSLSATDNEKIIIPVVSQEMYFIEVFGEAGDTNCYDLEIENFAAPVPSGVHLDPASDSGTLNNDLITNDKTPRFIVLADLTAFNEMGIDILSASEADSMLAGTGTTPGAAVEVFATNSTTGVTVRGFAEQIGPSTTLFDFTPAADLDEGVYFVSAAVRIFDGQEDAGGDPDPATGRSLLSEPLWVTLDCTPPFKVVGDPSTADDGLHPDSDSGVSGSPSTFVDRVTNDTTPTFFGFAEPGTVILGFVVTDDNGTPLDPNDDTLVLIGTAVADPDVGNSGSAGGWTLTSTVNMNDPNKLAALPYDGLRLIRFFGRDVAGNLTDPMDLTIFIDTQGPQITGVGITGSPAYNFFGNKPNGAQGATPAVDSITINVQDLPNRVTEFLYRALEDRGTGGDPASDPGNYLLVGDANGAIAIDSVVVNNAVPTDGNPATATIVLTLAEPLPDDRFTLTISDEVVDPAGNRLDGESNTAEPNGSPGFPSGDGTPGGDFVARFTLDSRPEIGDYAGLTVSTDTNGNFTFDPTNEDATNRDLTFEFGSTNDQRFTGKFVLNGFNGAALPFDVLAAYGNVGGDFRLLVDTNLNGAFDPAVDFNLGGFGVDGLVVPFDFDAVNPGDEIMIFDGTTWFRFTITQPGGVSMAAAGASFATNILGYPIAGDFDGDGLDDLGTYQDNTFFFDLANDGLGAVADPGGPDATITTLFAIGVGERPVAADMDLDGIDDIGLWIPDTLTQQGAEWRFLLSGNRVNPVGTVDALNHPYSPTPLGSDLSAHFGNTFALPILGNLDPPLEAENDAPPTLTASAATLNALTLKLTDAELSATDVDSDDATLEFTVKSLPSHGQLTNGAAVLGVNDKFTQQDIADGDVSFTHDGSNTISDSFTFTVRDNAGNETGTAVFSITAGTMVTHAGDSGPGSLRLALLNANATAGIQTIDFDFAGAGPHTITPLSALPTITEAVVIDGTTEPDFAGTPVIELDGGAVAATANGLNLNAGASGSTIRGLAVNGFMGSGIGLNGSSNNVLEGNFVGVGTDGTTDAGNGFYGVAVFGGANNRIGGTTAAQRNVISGNGSYGVLMTGAGASGNTVEGNFIGTNAAGDAKLANGLDGVVIAGGANLNTVGGTQSGARNLISGNDGHGVAIGAGSNNNTVQGNLIGTNAAGTAALGNGLYGVAVLSSANNQIGGTSAAARNTLAGNRYGVAIAGASATGNKVEGNYIGTNQAGSGALGNLLAGVVLSQGSHTNTIGGTASGASNVISGNSGHGIAISAGSNGNTVQGNLVGTDASGNSPLGNTLYGLALFDSANNQIGGTTEEARNVLSANGRYGVAIAGASATGNKVEGNYIGTNQAGTLDFGNAFQGVVITSLANGNTIGGTATGAGNLISGNNLDGVAISTSATGNLVQGNRIGTDVSGDNPLPNTQSGVLIYAASNNQIGGAATGAGNVIGYNGSRGVNVAGGGTGNSIRQNSIFDNTNLGIDLNNNGATANDAGDPDSGANNLQNFPEITSVVLSGGNLDITYSVPSSTANSAYDLTIEFFLADSANQEGEVFLGTATYSDATNAETDTIAIPGGVTVNAGDRIVATATDAGGNTSEFTASIAVSVPLLAAGGEAAMASSQVLTTADVDPLLDYAIAAWAAVGINDSQLALLEGLQVHIADLSGALLGTQVGNTITLDINAAGHGWFVSRGSRDKSLESQESSDKSQEQEGDGASSGSGHSTRDSRLRIDLLTVIYHEMGHAAGLEDDYSDPDSDEIMHGWLPTGVRRLPTVDDLDGLFANREILDELLV